MSTVSADPRRRAAAWALALLLPLGGTTGCGFLAGEPDRPAPVSGTAAVAAALQDLLDRQARAVRDGDRAAYASTLAATGDGRRRGLRLFDNLTALPLARYDLEVDPTTVVRTPGGAVAQVTSVLQLDGLDAVAVSTPALARFAAVGGADGTRSYAVRRARDAGWAREHGIAPQPWEVARLVVRRGDGVLVVADRGTAPAAAGLVGSVEAAVADVAPLVPYDWDRTVVVYALSDTAVLAGLADVPGGDTELLDGVSVPVRAEVDGGPVASTRVVLHPRTVADGGAGRDRLLRHELVHVALGARDDALPTWLAEGLAEWVSVQPLAPADRTIARAAVEAARDGLDGLPEDQVFNGPGSAVNYGTAWFAVDHLATTYGAAALWELVEVLRVRGSDPATVDAVLTERLGLTSADLASAAGTRIVTTFG